MQDLSLLHWQNCDFLKAPIFGKLFKWPWSCQKFQNKTKRVLGHVPRCLVSKFNKTIPMRSVPNCWWEIPKPHAIRWFKFYTWKPKISKVMEEQSLQSVYYRSFVSHREEKCDDKSKCWSGWHIWKSSLGGIGTRSVVGVDLCYGIQCYWNGLILDNKLVVFFQNKPPFYVLQKQTLAIFIQDIDLLTSSTFNFCFNSLFSWPISCRNVNVLMCFVVRRSFCSYRRSLGILP